MQPANEEKDINTVNMLSLPIAPLTNIDNSITAIQQTPAQPVIIPSISLFDQDCFPPNKTGHPFVYTPKQWLQICELYEGGETITKACEMCGIDRTEYYTLIEDFPELAHRHDKANKRKAHFLIEQAQTIADDTSNDVFHNPRGDSGNMAAVKRADLRMGLRERLAGLFNAQYRKQETVNINSKSVNVNVDIKPGTQLDAESLLSAFSSSLK